MHTRDLSAWAHQHTFGQDRTRNGEARTRWVALLTAATMGVEIAAGVAFGSMALLADGLHMASHATALGIAVLAYAYTRRFAADARYSFGTGKVNALGGFASAILLVMFAAAMAVESVERVLDPVAIAFDQAILVAVLGLLVNGLSVFILAAPGHPHAGHAHAGHAHHHGNHSHNEAAHGPRERAQGQEDRRERHGGGHVRHVRHVRPGGGEDHNLHAAYLHVLADSLTSVLAIVALLLGKLFGLIWLDPAMGIVGAVLIARWSWGLLRETGGVLLDRQAPQTLRDRLRRALEDGSNDRVADLHVWSVGPGIFAAEIAVVSDDPRAPELYKSAIPRDLGIVHATVEVHRCPAAGG